MFGDSLLFKIHLSWPSRPCSNGIIIDYGRCGHSGNSARSTNLADVTCILCLSYVGQSPNPKFRPKKCEHHKCNKMVFDTNPGGWNHKYCSRDCQVRGYNEKQKIKKSLMI